MRKEYRMKASRRVFLKGIAGVAALGAGGCVTVRHSDRVKLAVVGIWGKGYEDMKWFLTHGKCEIVALCDCDRNMLPVTQAQLNKDGFNIDISKIPFFTDYRRMLDNAGKLGIEAMQISTPDHMHAAIAINAMKMGIHVYVQKPLVRTLWELERFKVTAKEYGVITQMGNQGSSGSSFRRGVEIMHSGILGDVSEVHVWTNRPVWPQGNWAKGLLQRPNDPIPSGLDWDAWIGTAKMRPYKGERGVDSRDYPWCVKVGNTKVYHQFNWRGFTDFGAGALGDMASHLMNLPYRGLRLGAMAWANCRAATEVNSGIYPATSIVDIGFVGHPGLKFTWYEGGLKPPSDLTAPMLKVEPKGIPVGGCVIVGSKGTLYSTDNYGQTSYLMLKGESKPVSILEHEVCKDVAMRLPRRPEPGTTGNYGEFIDAILGAAPYIEDVHSRCYGDVEHSIPLMEGMLAACAAQCVPETRLNWDTSTQRFDNPVANGLIKPYVRSGWEF